MIVQSCPCGKNPELVCDCASCWAAPSHARAHNRQTHEVAHVLNATCLSLAVSQDTLRQACQGKTRPARFANVLTGKPWNVGCCAFSQVQLHTHTQCGWVNAVNTEGWSSIDVITDRFSHFSFSRPPISVLCRRGAVRLPKNQQPLFQWWALHCKCGTCATRVVLVLEQIEVRRARCECWWFSFLCTVAVSNMLTHWLGSPVDQAHTPSAPTGC